MKTVHVRNDSANGKDVERAQEVMRYWHERGYSVAPVPVDWREHPYDQVCPACSGGKTKFVVTVDRMDTTTVGELTAALRRLADGIDAGRKGLSRGTVRDSQDQMIGYYEMKQAVPE